MTNWLLRWVMSAIALWVVANIGIGVHVTDTTSLAEATVVIGLVNSLIRPILKLLTLPLNCMTLGLFGLILNGALFAATHILVPGFNVTSFLGFVLGPILMSLIAGLLNNLLPDKKE